MENNVDIESEGTEKIDRNGSAFDEIREPLLLKSRVNTTSQIAIVGANVSPIESLDYEIFEEEYVKSMKEEIYKVVQHHEELDIDVMVHGESERNDMVEYFSEQLSGFAFTANGWVQSYGSRCVKPPIIYGDVSRPKAMTVF